MKALAWTPARQAVDLIDLPEPTIESDQQVLLRMIRGGLCGTDREIVQHGVGLLPDGCGHLVMGHESMAEVAEIGTGVQGLRPGDRVAIAPRRPCAQRCVQCRQGRPDLCQTGDYREMGIVGLHGMFSEWLVEEAGYLFRLPAELHGVGVLMEPASVVEKALTRVALARQALFGDPFSRRVLVLGAGPIGILASLLAMAQGSRVWTVSIEDPQSRSAEILGTAGIAYAQPGQLEARDFDCLVDCTGHPTAVFEHLDRLAHNGIVAMVGAVPHGTRREIDVGALLTDAVLKNQVFLGTVNADAQSWRKASEKLAAIESQRPGLLASLVTHRLGWREAGAAFFQRQDGEIKTVLEFER